MKKIIIASDHAAVALKEKITTYLKKCNYDVKSMGVDGAETVDYPDIAVAACEEFLKGKYEFGILLCGTGIGVTIAANKIKGIRCALLTDIFTAEMAKAHNDANFIAFGGRVNYNLPVEEIIDKFMSSSLAGDERHERRIRKIMEIEKRCCPTK